MNKWPKYAQRWIETPLPVGMVAPRAVISLEKGYTFFRVPKSGNSSVMATLFRVEMSRPFSSGGEFSDFKRNYFPRLLDLRLEQLEAAFEGNFVFSFVRHPVTRFASAYLEKVCNDGSERAKVVKALQLDCGADAVVTPDMFCSYLETGGLNRDAHWAEQSNLIPVRSESLNFIGKVERMRDDLAIVLKHIDSGVESIQEYRPHATNAEARMFEILGADVIRRVERLYLKDMDRFSYHSFLR